MLARASLSSGGCLAPSRWLMSAPAALTTSVADSSRSLASRPFSRALSALRCWSRSELTYVSRRRRPGRRNCAACGPGWPDRPACPGACPSSCPRRPGCPPGRRRGAGHRPRCPPRNGTGGPGLRACPHHPESGRPRTRRRLPNRTPLDAPWPLPHFSCSVSPMGLPSATPPPDLLRWSCRPGRRNGATPRSRRRPRRTAPPDPRWEWSWRSPGSHGCGAPGRGCAAPRWEPASRGNRRPRCGRSARPLRRGAAPPTPPRRAAVRCPPRRCRAARLRP